jgi:hypothetical protein
MITASNRFEGMKFLLKRKFPQVRVDAIGARGGNLIFSFGAYDKDVATEAEQYRTELQLMSDDQFHSLHRSELDRQKKELAKQQRREERDRFFNRRNAKTDIDHWARMAEWSLDEAIALSMGKDPKIVNAESLKPMELVSPFAIRYFKLHETAKRAVQRRQLSDPVLPGVFIAWALQNEIEFPSNLKLRVEARGNSIGNWKTAHDLREVQLVQLTEEYKKLQSAYNELLNVNAENIEQMKSALSEVINQRDTACNRLKELADQSSVKAASTAAEPPQQEEWGGEETSKRATNNMQRLIIAMAHKKYHFRPNRSKNSAIGNIMSDLEKLGLKMSEGTVLDHIRRASRHVDWAAIEADREP